MTVSFVGHSVIASQSDIKEIVKRHVRNITKSSSKITCYLGGYGDFDEICARVCKELKQEYDNIEVVYVPAYINLSEQAKIKKMQSCGLCDTSIYPPIENLPLKFAISKRNEWMMTNADIIIAYVDHSYGGAYRSLQAAKRRKKKIINVCDLLKNDQLGNC